MVVSLYLIKHNAMTTYVGREVVLHAFLTLALRLSRFAPAERVPGIFWLGGRGGGPQDAARNREMFCPCLELNSDSPVVQPTAYYEGSAVLVPLMSSVNCLFLEMDVFMTVQF